jgi:MFS family permease
VLAASFLIMFFNAGAQLMIGVMVKPLTTEFGWSRGTVSAAISLNLVVYALSLVGTGRLYDRFGPKWVLLFSGALFSGGLALMGVVHSHWQFLLFYGVVSAVGLAGVSAPIFGSLLSRWFEKRRGMAISLGMAGLSLGQFLLVPLYTSLLLDIGWRGASLWMGAVCFAVTVILVPVVIRGDPERLGKLPYGGVESGSTSRITVDHASAGVSEARSLGLREAMRTRSFWLFTVAMFVCGAGDYLVSVHLVPMATDLGISTSTAASMLASFGLLSLGGILLAGPASDLIGNRIPIALAFGLRVALFALILVYQTPASFWALAIGFGFTYLVTAPLTTTMLGKLYGFANIGLLGGFITMVHHGGGGLWAYLGGAIFDATGTYTLVLALAAAASAIALLCTLLVKETRHLPKGEH